MSVLKQFIQETESMASAELASNVVPFLEAKAARIRKLMQVSAENICALGHELMEAREVFPLEPAGPKGGEATRPGWTEWLKKEFGFSTDHAVKLIKIFNKFGQTPPGALTASFKVLDYLSRDHVPEKGREEVIQKIKAGEKIGLGRAKELIDEHRPTASEARKIAKETGKPTYASDGNIYFGASKQEEKDIEDRRRLVFDVRRAVLTLSTVEMTPTAFLGRALPHQLWNKEEEHQIAEAVKWLNALAAAWERR